MISFKTDLRDYYNDMCEVIRLFFGAEEISGENESGRLCIFHTFAERDGKWLNASSVYGDGREQTYEYSSKGCFADKLEIKREMKRSAKISLFRALSEFSGKNMPWGSLTGIRPVRLAADLSMIHGDTLARDILTDTFDVSDKKANLLFEILDLQRKVRREPKGTGIYIGIPFCLNTCLYCSFTSYDISKHGSMVNTYLQALMKEIAETARRVGLPEGGVSSVYIGGGTPTSIKPDMLAELLDHIGAVFGRPEELTLEAGRPDTLNKDMFDAISEKGITRLSINPQTMNGETLRRIGRAHTPEDIIHAFELAREYGFDNINADIILGLPGEDETHLAKTVDGIKRLGPESLTVHTLAIKRASRLKREQHGYESVPEEIVNNMLEAAESCAREMNMTPYYLYRQKYMSGNLENTGFCRTGKHCIYNIDIMDESASILAFGAGAISKRVFPRGRIERQANAKDLATYIEGIEGLISRKTELFAPDSD